MTGSPHKNADAIGTWPSLNNKQEVVIAFYYGIPDVTSYNDYLTRRDLIHVVR